MRSCLLLVGLTIIATGSVLLAEAAKQAPTDDATRERALRQMLADMADKNARLEAENKRLKEEIRELKARRAVELPQRVAPLQVSPAAPKNARSFEFNGETVYLIPLKSSGPLNVGNSIARPSSK
jgi:hypothetical protein